MNSNIEVYNSEKIRFSSLHNNFHKLLNTIKNGPTNQNNMSEDHIYKLLEINELIEILESKIIDFNENNSCLNDTEKSNILKNNKVLNDLMPLFIMYRTILN